MATMARSVLADGDRVTGMEALASSRKLTDWEAMFIGEMRKKLAKEEELNPRQKAVLQRFYDEHAAKGEIP